MARWHGFLQDYEYKIEHVPGKLHTAADALSRPPDADQDKDNNEAMIMIPESAFIRIADEDSPESLESRIIQAQNHHQPIMKAWEARTPLQRYQTIDGPMWKMQDTGKLAIPPDPELFREIMKTWHDLPTAGHPGRDKTTRHITNQYHWPGARQWIEGYVKGCATCQQNKNLTHRTRTPLYCITVPPEAQPFEQIAMDLITGLPKSEGYDAILTIADHGCSRGALFLPCHTTITGPQITQLYLNNVYRWFGLPKRIISDQDPRFTSHFGKALGKELSINWNLSSTAHPQTDGLSE
jgi:Integrase zinc binding domain